MLNGDQIKQRNLIQNGIQTSYRAASYDLTVGQIIAAGQESGSFPERVIIPPQGMVEVVSFERVKLPADIAGYTTLKNSLSNQGVLAISIGIIDPLYEGLMSSTLINFSKSPIEMRRRDAFLRVTFHDYQPKSDLEPPVLRTDQQYVSDRRRKVKQQVKQHFSDTFLDLETNVKKLTSRVFDEAFHRWRKALFVYIPLMAFFLALLTFFMNVGIARWGANRDLIKAELRKEIEQDEYKRLRDQINELRSRLELKADKINKPQPTKER